MRQAPVSRCEHHSSLQMRRNADATARNDVAARERADRFRYPMKTWVAISAPQANPATRWTNQKDPARIATTDARRCIRAGQCEVPRGMRLHARTPTTTATPI